MRLYIDKENLASFIENGSSVDGDAFYDCKRMMRRHMDVYYNFPKSEVLSEGSMLKAWFVANGTSGCGKNENICAFVSDKYPSRPIKSNFLKDSSIDESTAVYLVDEDVSTLQKSHTVLMGGVGEELSTLSKLMFNDEFTFHRLHNIQDKANFSGWQQLDSQGDVLPTTDILILDRYLFGGASDISEVDLENNLYAILKLYAQKAITKVNIVFLCDGIRNPAVWSARKSKIEKIFKRENKNCAVRITFIFYSKSYKRGVDGDKKLYPHDRIIITNYRMFRSGDSFCYYDSKGNIITNGLHLDIDSLADIDNFKYMKSVIQYAQDVYDDIKKLGNNDLIIGDKESNYINF